MKTVIPILRRNRRGQPVSMIDYACSRIRDSILQGKLPPGTPLSRRRLAEELTISTVPVTQALQRLESEGLVECRAQAGTRVKIATAQEIHGNYVLREALETHSARLFAESAEPKMRRRLWIAAEKLDAAYLALAHSRSRSAARHAKVERGHIALHMLIAEATGVPVLIQEIKRSRVLLFNWLFTLSSEFTELPERWHRDLARVLVEGSADQAAEVMGVHVRFRQSEVIAKFQELAEKTSKSERMVRGPQRRTLEANGSAGLLL
jgi:GntR family transcriptional regulator, rspAB operon transcriptional repressor